MSKNPPLPDLYPGPSSYGRLKQCIRSEAERHYGQADKPWTTLGTVMHAFFADCLTVGREEALWRAPAEHREPLAAVDLERLPAFDPEAYKPEVWIAVMLKTRQTRVLGYDLPREKARALMMPGEIVCGLDVLGVAEDAAVVFDYKTGRGHVDPAVSNMQLRTYGWAAALHFGKDHVRYGVIRTPPFAKPWWDMAEMDYGEIEAHGFELEDLMADRARAIQLAKDGQREELDRLFPFVTGDHCHYCPAKRGCEAHTRLYAQVPELGDLANLNDEEFGRAFLLHLRRKDAVDLMDGYFRSVAEQKPIQLPGGQFYGPREENHEDIIPGRARAVYAQLWGEQMAAVVYSAAVDDEPTISKKRQRDAISRYVVPTLPEDEQVIGRIENIVMASLREAQAVIPKVEQKMKTYRPGKKRKGEEEA